MTSAHWYTHLMMTEPDAYLVEKHFCNDAINTRDVQLARIYAYFDSPHASFDVETLRALAPNCLLHMIDTSSNDPAGYQLVRYDRRATLDGGRDYTNLLLGDYPIRVYRENMEQQVCTAWAMRTRRYSEVKWSRDGGETRLFHRLIVPLRQAPVRRDLAEVFVATHPQPLDIAA